ncbi:SigE family RNA polymerase sigma factor [Kribbella hippodromi]
MTAELAAVRGQVEDRRRAQATDFDEYVVARYQQLVRMARLLTQDWALAEDLVQSALVKCWGAWGSIRSEDPTAYVRRTVLTTYFAWYCWRRSRPERLTSIDLERPAVDEYSVVENADLLDALRALPKRQCAVIVLRYFEDLTEAETAAALGCSVGTVKSQAHRALRRLQVALSAAGQADEEAGNR